MNDSFEIATGVMDVSRVVGDVDYIGTDAIRRATLSGIQQCCTATRPPLVARARHPDCDIDLAVLVASKVECFAADGAADEQLVGRELTTTLAGDTTTEIRDTIVKELVNLKVAVAGCGCSIIFRNHSCGMATTMILTTCKKKRSLTC